MDVRIDDPAARQRAMWWVRGLGLALAFVTGSAAHLLLIWPLWRLIQAIGFVAFLFGPLVPALLSRGRSGELTLAPGAVRVRTRLGTTVLRGDKLAGATTSLEAGTGRFVLTMSFGRMRQYPVSLTFAHAAELETVRRALGVGQIGRGILFIAGGRTARLRRFARVVSVVLGLGLVAALLAPTPLVTLLAAVLGTYFCFGLLVADLVGSGSVELWGDRLVILHRATRREHFYAQISGVEERGDEIVLRAADGREIDRMLVPTKGVFAPFRERERDLLVAQVEAAVARSHALPPLRMGAADGLENLRRLRAEGERPAGWVSRLDAIAYATTSAGYREASLDVGALWSTLEDPDADVELRCAAARILHRRAANEGKARSAAQANAGARPAASDPRELRLRIATAVESAADEPSRARLRLMIADELEPEELERTFEPPVTTAAAPRRLS